MSNDSIEAAGSLPGKVRYMIGNSPSPPPNEFDTLARAWLASGATAVSVWERERLIHRWPSRSPLGEPNFVTPVRLEATSYGEMRISGFEASGWSEWRSRDGASWPAVEHSDALVRRRNAPRAPQVLRHGLDLHAESRPALRVGGDYYDIIYGTSGHIAFSVADVSGKGLRAAMHMPAMHRALRRGLQACDDSAPHELLMRTNVDTYRLFEAQGRFATALLGYYDPTRRTVTYANAGHSPVIHRSADGEMRLLRADTTPLGIQRQTESIARTVSLGPGTLLMIATDGITEAKNQRGQMYGQRRLAALLNAVKHKPAHIIVRMLFEQVGAFSGRSLQDDDQTVMVLVGR